MAKHNDIEGLGRINQKQPENAFSIEYDAREGQYFYNLLDTVHIDVDSFRKDLYIEYVMAVGEDLYSLSKRFYGSVDLWWLIAESSSLECICGDLTGTVLKIPVPEVAKKILETIENS